VHTVGLLDAVANLEYEVLESGRSVSIAWTAPFSQNASITYCVNVSSAGALTHNNSYSAAISDFSLLQIQITLYSNQSVFQHPTILTPRARTWKN
jgi:hypothetical protein